MTGTSPNAARDRFELARDAIVERMRACRASLHMEGPVDAASFDKTLRGRVYDNMDAWRSLQDDFAVIVMFCEDGEIGAHSADTFFASASRRLAGSPGALLFVGADERVVGRCTTTQLCGTGCVATTFVHSRADEGAYMSIAGLCDEFSRLDSLAACLGAIKETASCYETSYLDFALRECADRVAMRCRRELHMWHVGARAEEESEMAEPDADADVDTDTDTEARPGARLAVVRSGAEPDLRAMFADFARGPTVTRADVKSYGEGVDCVTVMGGSVAVLAVAHDAAPGLVTAAPRTFDLLRADPEVRVIFAVDQSVERSCVLDSPHVTMSTLPRPMVDVPAQGCSSILLVHVSGCPVAHVAHVLLEAAYLAFAARGPSPTSIGVYEFWMGDEMRDLLAHACDATVHSRVLENVTRANMLRHRLRARVDRDLGGIKARLWAPDAPLLRRFVANELAVGGVGGGTGSS